MLCGTQTYSCRSTQRLACAFQHLTAFPSRSSACLSLHIINNSHLSVSVSHFLQDVSSFLCGLCTCLTLPSQTKCLTLSTPLQRLQKVSLFLKNTKKFILLFWPSEDITTMSQWESFILAFCQWDRFFSFQVIIIGKLHTFDNDVMEKLEINVFFLFFLFQLVPFQNRCNNTM